eukprot:3522548-Rhodomonas_salina.1
MLVSYALATKCPIGWCPTQLTPRLPVLTWSMLLPTPPTNNYLPSYAFATRRAVLTSSSTDIGYAPTPVLTQRCSYQALP